MFIPESSTDWRPVPVSSKPKGCLPPEQLHERIHGLF